MLESNCDINAVFPGAKCKLYESNVLIQHFELILFDSGKLVLSLFKSRPE